MTEWEFPEARLMVFAKAPIAGEVKTRLIPLLGAKGAAGLHEQLCIKALGTAVAARLCPVQLWCAPATDHVFFETCQDRYGVGLHRQHGADLGARMAHAFEQVLQNSPFAIIIGTDCPSLTRQDLRDAMLALEQGHDAVISPAEDGGYVQLGLSKVTHTLFDGIRWGGNDVLDMTRARLRQLGWNWHELGSHWDVDRPEDVGRMLFEGLLGDATLPNKS